MNIPNILTVIRIILVPIFIITFFSVNKWIALIIFIIAGITDFLDGYIARKYDLITDLGVVLDPFADKLMLISVLVVFTMVNYIPLFILIIVVTKELFMIFFGAKFYFSKNKIVIPANKYGKITTVLFYISITIITFNINEIINNVLIFAVAISTMVAFISYYKIAKREIKK